MARQDKTHLRPSPRLNIPDTSPDESLLNLYDPNNPDIDMFNLVDDEMIKLSGSKLYIFKYNSDENYDPVFGEDRNKAINTEPIVAWGHYDARALEEPLGEFGVEVTNDQVFIFNRSYIERVLGRILIAGDIIKPEFQNQKYEVHEVQEDSFEVYGVYHLNCFAKLLRDSSDVQDTPIVNVPDEVGGYSGEIDKL